MIKLHANILENNGVKQFAVLPFEEFLKIQELLEDYQDLQDLKKAVKKEKHIPGMSLSEARKQLRL